MGVADAYDPACQLSAVPFSNCGGGNPNLAKLFREVPKARGAQHVQGSQSAFRRSMLTGRMLRAADEPRSGSRRLHVVRPCRLKPDGFEVPNACRTPYRACRANLARAACFTASDTPGQWRAKCRSSDVVLVWAFDRVARSVRHFLEILDELRPATRAGWRTGEARAVGSRDADPQSKRDSTGRLSLSAQVLLYALQKYWRGVDHWTKFGNFEQCALDVEVSDTVHPSGGKDRRAAHPADAVEQHFPLADVLRHGGHDRLETLEGDGAGIVNRDAHIFDVAPSRQDLRGGAQRNDRRDSFWVGGCKAFGVFESRQRTIANKVWSWALVVLLNFLSTNLGEWIG